MYYGNTVCGFQNVLTSKCTCLSILGKLSGPSETLPAPKMSIMVVFMYVREATVRPRDLGWPGRRPGSNEDDGCCEVRFCLPHAGQEELLPLG